MAMCNDGFHFVSLTFGLAVGFHSVSYLWASSSSRRADDHRASRIDPEALGNGGRRRYGLPTSGHQGLKHGKACFSSPVLFPPASVMAPQCKAKGSRGMGYRPKDTRGHIFFLYSLPLLQREGPGKIRTKGYNTHPLL